MMKSRVLFGLSLALLTLTSLPAAAAEHPKLRVTPGSEMPEKPLEIIKDEAKLDTLLYKPEYCDFHAKFPSEPVVSHRCEQADQERCYDLVSYTKVFEMSATVKAEIVCNPLPEGAFDQYTPEVMKKTVESMAMGEVLQGFEPQVVEEMNHKHAGMVGRGRAGMGDTMFIAQIWVGRHSIMAVQAEIMGEPTKEAEAHFAQILSSIGYEENEEEKAARLAKQEAEKKAAEEAAENPEQAPAEKPADQQPEDKKAE